MCYSVDDLFYCHSYKVLVAMGIKNIIILWGIYVSNVQLWQQFLTAMGSTDVRIVDCQLS